MFDQRSTVLAAMLTSMHCWSQPSSSPFTYSPSIALTLPLPSLPSLFFQQAIAQRPALPQFRFVHLTFVGVVPRSIFSARGLMSKLPSAVVSLSTQSRIADLKFVQVVPDTEVANHVSRAHSIGDGGPVDPPVLQARTIVFQFSILGGSSLSFFAGCGNLGQERQFSLRMCPRAQPVSTADSPSAQGHWSPRISSSGQS